MARPFSPRQSVSRPSARLWRVTPSHGHLATAGMVMPQGPSSRRFLDRRETDPAERGVSAAGCHLSTVRRLATRRRRRRRRCLWARGVPGCGPWRRASSSLAGLYPARILAIARTLGARPQRTRTSPQHARVAARTGRPPRAEPPARLKHSVSKALLHRDERVT